MANSPVNHTFTTDEIIERLEVLWRKLNDEGRYISANTVAIALERLEEISNDQARNPYGVTSRPAALLQKPLQPERASCPQ